MQRGCHGLPVSCQLLPCHYMYMRMRCAIHGCWNIGTRVRLVLRLRELGRRAAGGGLGTARRARREEINGRGRELCRACVT